MRKTQSCVTPEATTGSMRLAAETAAIMDKKQYSRHWLFSVRNVDNLLAQGLPHCKVGARRVRIFVAEADAWMKQRFGTQRRGPIHTTTKTAEAA